jgi:hypothetical protein
LFSRLRFKAEGKLKNARPLGVTVIGEAEFERIAGVS